MIQEYSKEQLRKLHINLPQELKDAMGSLEVSDSIYEVTQRYKIKEDEKLKRISELVGYVLMGILPPSKFESALQKDIKLSKDIAEKVAHEINRFVFYPVRPALEQLHEIPNVEGKQQPLQERIDEPIQKSPSIPTSEDPYREVIEEEKD